MARCTESGGDGRQAKPLQLKQTCELLLKLRADHLLEQRRRSLLVEVLELLGCMADRQTYAEATRFRFLELPGAFSARARLRK
jgi:hypothetical protein